MYDPRKVGGIYYSDFWKMVYTVLRIQSGWYEVQWENGEVEVHCTYWGKNDRAVYQPV